MDDFVKNFIINPTLACNIETLKNEFERVFNQAKDFTNDVELAALFADGYFQGYINAHRLCGKIKKEYAKLAIEFFNTLAIEKIENEK